MESNANNLKQIFIIYANKCRYYIIGVIVFFAVLLIFLGVKKNTTFEESSNYYIFDGSVYNDEKYNIKYDDNNNIVYFDSSDDDDYAISYKYSYNNDKISSIFFEGTYFSSEIKGEFSFEYIEDNISIINLKRKYKDVENVDYYVFHYDDNNRVIKVDHDKGGIWTSTAESPYGCNYYYYDKYVIANCHNTEINQPNLKESYFTEYYKRSIYVADKSIKNSKNLWVANNIAPFIYYGINFPHDISSDVSLLGSSYDVAYNPGKILYSVSKKYNTLNNKTDVFASKIYYSNGNVIKEEYGENLDVWNITMFKDNKRVSSIDSMNNNYEFLYTYKNNNIVQKKKQRKNYSTLINKYNDYFKSIKLDYDIDDIIENLDSIIKKQSNNPLTTQTNDTLLGGQSNNSLPTQTNDTGKQSSSYDFNAVEPSIKIENDYYKVAINDNHWVPKFILSDNIDYYEVTWYFDNQKWYKSQSFDYVETNDEGIIYSVWISGIVIGTKPADPGIHTLKVEIKDKRTGKIAFDEATIECY